MKFSKLNTPRGMKPIQSEHYRFTVTRLEDGSDAFTNRKPRSDSRFWDTSRFMIWDNERNEGISRLY